LAQPEPPSVRVGSYRSGFVVAGEEGADDGGDIVELTGETAGAQAIRRFFVPDIAGRCLADLPSFDGTLHVGSPFGSW
jgi:hypothetical protein